MLGAEGLIRTLLAGGVDTCFTNPGTSEMHFVAALDDVPEMHAILTLFEGVATGAADGYERMADKPAATLLHLGPGQGNGLANLHNARRAGSGVVNIVGDHATGHRQYDAPLASDIESVARTVSRWVRTPETPDELVTAAAKAVAAATGPRAGIATIITPADTCWGVCSGPAGALEPRGLEPVDTGVIDEISSLMRGDTSVGLLLGGRAVADPEAIHAAARLRAAGVTVLQVCFPRRNRRGAGIPMFDRINYLPEFADAQLADLDHIVLADALSPASFFAYPDRPSSLLPTGCTEHVLSGHDDDTTTALLALAEAVGAPEDIEVAESMSAERPSGELGADTLAHAIATTMPNDAIISDEATTSGIFIAPLTAGGPQHDWLNLTGGSIGDGMPVATGAAVACPDRPVLSLQADGSAMYTIQSLWTQARENLDVTTLLFNNRSYAILKMELDRVGAGKPDGTALDMLDLSRPDLDFVKIGEGLGVDSVRASSAEDLCDQIDRAVAEDGPHLIEVVIPPVM